MIEHKNEELQRNTKLHPKFIAFQYPLIFPYGEDNYRSNIK